MAGKDLVGQQKPRLIDIANEAGVTQMVVSMVLNPRPSSVRVSKATQQKVLGIAEKLGYQPNLIAQQLAGKCSKLIGVALDTYNVDGQEPALIAMESYASTYGFRFLTGYTHDNLEQITDYATDFMGRGVAGVVVVAHNYPMFGSKVAELFSRFKNSVFVHKPQFDQPVNYVTVDYCRATEIAAERLFSLGRKRVVLAIRDLNYSCNKHLVEGYKKAVSAAGLEFSSRFVVESGIQFLSCEAQWGNNLAKEIISRKADGVLVGSDIEAMWLIRALRQRGVRVPADIGIIGLCHWKIGEAFFPSLTSVDLRQGDVALEAISMLITDINSPEESGNKTREVILEPYLVEGDSCGKSLV